MKFSIPVSLAVLAASSCLAQAADMYQPTGGGYKDGPVYVANTWTGFYVGVNGGYGFNSGQSISYDTGYAGGARDYHAPYDKLDQKGGFGGGQVGYNFQSDHFVYGVEADFQGSGISGSASGTPPYDSWGTYGVKGSLDWFGTVRGRLGYAFGPALLYATGGFAFGDVKGDISYRSSFPSHVVCGACADATGTSHSSDVGTGYTVGGGVEYKLTPKWSVKAEYQYIDLGTHSATTGVSNYPTDTLTLHTKIDDNYSTVRAGLNYHIGDAGYEPLK